MFAMWFFLSLYLQQVLGYSPVVTGLTFLPQTAAIAIGATLSGRLAPRLGPRNVLMTGGAIGAGGLFWLSFIQAGDTYWTGACGGGILATFGMGLAFTPIALLATGGVPPTGRRPGLGPGQLQPPDRRLGGPGRADHPGRITDGGRPRPSGRSRCTSRAATSRRRGHDRRVRPGLPPRLQRWYWPGPCSAFVIPPPRPAADRIGRADPVSPPHRSLVDGLSTPHVPARGGTTGATAGAATTTSSSAAKAASTVPSPIHHTSTMKVAKVPYRVR